MKRLDVVAMAVLAACGASARAQEAPSIYGLVDASAGRFQLAGAKKLWQLASGSLSTSFIGFKGADDLGGGIKAKFALESYLGVDTGTVGRRAGDAFFARNAYVGFEGGFGSTVLGSNTTPLYASATGFNVFGASAGLSPSVRQLFSPTTGLAFFGDTRWNNSISYASPVSERGWSFNLLGNLGEDSPGSTGKNLGANVLYVAGPLAATVAYQQVRNGALGVPPGWNRQRTLLLGASYDLVRAKLFGQAGLVRTDATTDTETRLYSFGIALPVGAGQLLAQYGNAEADFGGAASRTTNRSLSVGYDYFFSKRTDIYAVYMNDRTTGLAAGNTLAGGLRLRF